MSLNPDNYSLTEFIKLKRRAKDLEASLWSARVLDSGAGRSDDCYTSWVTYELTGEVADDMRRLFDDPEGLVKVHNRSTLETLMSELIVTVGKQGQRFSGRDGVDNLFEHFVAWLDDQLKRKAWRDDDCAPVLYDGAL